MKNITLLTVFILLYFLFTGPVYSQSKITQKDADNFLGTWTGIISRGATNIAKMDYSVLLWRIHKVDIDKNQIEMTEIYYKAVSDTVSTDKLRMIYPARIENKSLHIQLTDRDTTFTLKLLPMIIDGKQNLRSEPGILRFKDQEVSYMIEKVDSDTTNLPPKDQRKVVTVIVQPPPPMDPKKQ